MKIILGKKEKEIDQILNSIPWSRSSQEIVQFVSDQVQLIIITFKVYEIYNKTPKSAINNKPTGGSSYPSKKKNNRPWGASLK